MIIIGIANKCEPPINSPRTNKIKANPGKVKKKKTPYVINSLEVIALVRNTKELHFIENTNSSMKYEQLVQLLSMV